MPGRISRLILRAVLVAGFLAGSITATWANESQAAWSQVSKPTRVQAQSLGFYAAGCIAGAEALALQGPGFQVMRQDRNRYYGHPRLIRTIQTLGLAAQAQGARLLIGDLSQPRGGPMNYGHSSHQVGLDADIWLRHVEHEKVLSRKQTLTLPMRSVVDKKRGRLILEHWSPIYTDLLRTTAQHTDVARGFVNPVIKQALCRDPVNHAWLSKIRPWWGHDAHFHVRLNCPPDSPQCRSQDPPVADSGCDKYLDQWVRDQMSPPKKKSKSSGKRKARSLPSACAVVLRQ